MSAVLTELRNYFWSASVIRAVMRQDRETLLDLDVGDDQHAAGVAIARNELEAISMHSEMASLQSAANRVLVIAEPATAKVAG